VPTCILLLTVLFFIAQTG